MTEETQDSGNHSAVPEEPVIVTASVESIDDARVKREQLEQAIADELKKEPVEVVLGELHTYKLLHLNDRIRNERERIVAPLKAEVQARLTEGIEKLKQQCEASLQEAVNKALVEDGGFNMAQREQINAVNDVVDEVTPTLPPGYAITLVDPDRKRVLGAFNPEQRGKKLDVPSIVESKG